MWRPAVIVIGAGAAGLTAARALSRSGVAVQILEARQRIGGRIHTLNDPLSPVPVELGAEFIHGKPPEIFDEVASGRLAVLEVEAEAHWAAEEQAQDSDGDPLAALMPALEAAPEQSFAEFIEHAGVSADARSWVTRYVEGFNAARAERISVQGLVRMEKAADAIEGHRSFRLSRGYGALTEWLWTGMDHALVRMRFGAAVERVTWRRGRVEVQSSAGNFEAPRAVVTVPLGVLKAGAVAFDPFPKVLGDALAGIEMGHAIRMVLRFRRPVWEDRAEFSNLGFLFSKDCWMPTWWTTLPVRSPVITGWMAGRRAEEREDCEPSHWLAEALSTLGRLLGTSAAELAGELEGWRTHNWRDDPFARGAYSYPRAGGLEARRRLGEPIEETLYFAGEATNSDGHEGTVHGAIATGTRAARQILQAG
ncbi:MAG TPA: NAD(P)/FAD-dependent oxidoreductase [Bryobacteraceae bacterium]|nr:NAD(P)/FAD-dependent oxidoreductase [Bryobacteraceae bacterium]